MKVLKGLKAMLDRRERREIRGNKARKVSKVYKVNLDQKVARAIQVLKANKGKRVDKGERGPQGLQGPKGEPGQNAQPDQSDNNPTPQPTPTNDNDLANAVTANLWIHLRQDPSLPDYLQVFADPAFDVATFDLDVFVDGISYCNGDDFYGDEGAYELSCAFEEKMHTSVERVSANVADLGGLRCARHSASDSTETIFACRWR